MTDETDALVPWAEPRPLTPSEILTAEFYAWERRGRGWSVWPYPVELEPPFRPFWVYVAPGPVRPLDDARRPTFLSSVVDAVREWFKGAPAEPSVIEEEEFSEPEPSPFVTDAPLTQFQVALPPALKITKEAAEQFLLSLGYCSQPLSFEVIGMPESVAVQFTCREPGEAQVREQLKAHFPDAVLREHGALLERSWDRSPDNETVIVDFGLSEEFMLPLRTFRGFDIDPLIAAAGALASLENGEVGVLQVLFQAVRHPWATTILQSVTDSEGKSFFADAPQILALAKEKVSRPLFAAVIRLAAQSPRSGRAWQIVKALGGTFLEFANPQSNELIPLENGGYDDGAHEEDLLKRTAHRSGMLLNSEELVSLVHLPSASVRVEKLQREIKKTKPVPASATGHRLVLGENASGGRTATVSLSPEQRARHTYVVGASGTGKSTLLLNLIVQDLRNGEGLAVLDPHGDLIDQVLGFVPNERLHDVVLIDPSDEDYPVGLNLLSAHSALEKSLLASDLVAVFQRLSTTWGDQMTSVLGNAVLAFLESDQGGTIADLRRFLVEPEYRRRFLETVRDPEVVYYWQKEFPLLTGRPQAPILTRLDIFLRPKAIRYMVGQKEDRLDLGAIINEGKILLAKLAHGAIGEENAYLLGTLLVSKLHQLAMSRQEMTETERRPFYLYVDEFHNFATPSMAAALAGARKYRLGLVLAHQDLRQLGQSEVASAVLTNPCTRVCFRVGDMDAKRLADGFAFFDAKDLQTLGIGEAICRVERADYDFNLQALPLPVVDSTVAKVRRERIVAESRERYATPRDRVESLFAEERQARVLTAQSERSRPQRTEPLPEPAVTETPETPPTETVVPLLPGRGGPQHKYLQSLVGRLGEERGFKPTVEKAVLGGHGHVDVALEREGLKVACEISVTTRVEHEVENLTKCLAAGFDYAVLVCSEERTLRSARSLLAGADQERIRFLIPDGLGAFLDELTAAPEPPETVGEGESVAPTGAGPSGMPASVEAKKRLLIAKDAASYIGLASQTLAKMRVTGDSPPFYKVGRQVLYDRADLDNWLAERRRRSTSDPGQTDR